MTKIFSFVHLRGGLRGLLAGNVVARLGAFGALGLATVMVARSGGPSLVGGFTLLRVLPGLAGVLAAAGLPGAAPYYLASRAHDPRLRSTLSMLTVAGSIAATVAWLALAPVLHRVFFAQWGIGLILAASLAVFGQLYVAVGKALLQGDQDLAGANVAIVAEEAAFLPAYAALLLFGGGTGPMVAALIAADIIVALGIAERLRRRGFFRGWRAPSARLARDICGYGARGQVGGLLTLLNLRLDVAILGALASPAALGVYAIASKYADLLRLPGLAVNYVLYPLFSRRGELDARQRTRKLLLPSFGLNVVAAIPLALLVGPTVPLLFGAGFDTARLPAWILLAGATGGGLSGLIGAYLYGIGRPGLNSVAIGVGVIAAVAGDIALIPPYGAVGAATATAISGLVTVATLLTGYQYASRRGPATPAPIETPPASREPLTAAAAEVAS